MSRRLAAIVVHLAAAMLPTAERDWGRAMVAEAVAIRPAGPALRFACGCLWAAFVLRLSRHFARQEPKSMPLSLIDRPRRVAAACAGAAVGLGFCYMAAGEAPASYFAMNGAALLLGLLALGALVEAGRLGRVPNGLITLLLAVVLLLVSLWGVPADGVTRWVAVGGVSLQPSFILVPVLALSFARSSDGLSALAIIVAALALAIQPDRAMAGALAAGLATLALARRDRAILAGLTAALLAFVATLIQADPSPAVPFVDQIFYSSFTVHPLAGLAVWSGAALMIVPAIIGLARDPDHRPLHAVFGAIWLAVIAAAALGNYPTPLVGYGGSAILGYLISLIGLPPRMELAAAESGLEPEAERVGGPGALRARLA